MEPSSATSHASINSAAVQCQIQALSTELITLATAKTSPSEKAVVTRAILDESSLKERGSVNPAVTAVLPFSASVRAALNRGPQSKTQRPQRSEDERS
ncbi:hypothetical protein RW1_098_00030 [Rhodococcus wratislaviensis NBRC 100605]|uniref:Uncharacterized protein n=1 Tax=Rhodococcus wratislaviensis NBRC 100605 TaxID=1219028 RepID=X0QKX2_RHOWR|nr:hypothetical protein RW1_098_00030 [Rhodococcus wratislaviensis NBRC 100605]